MQNVTDTVRYIGIYDRDIRLFEGQYTVPDGMAYNSYVILDEKIAVMDSVEMRFGEKWLKNIKNVLGDKTPDYLIVQHMEPDHSANVDLFMKTYPEAKIVSSAKAFNMMKNFFGTDYPDRKITVGEGSSLSLGNRTLSFLAAPMVHWPEVILTYDNKDKILFSADAFGRFGSNEKYEDWKSEARRYYIGIVAKYGAQVQTVLKKAADLDIEKILPLHGEVLTDNLGYYIDLYDLWSKYMPETKGVAIIYTSVYGHTKKAIELLAENLKTLNETQIELFNLSSCDVAEAVAAAFRYDRIVLASTTYNMDVFPFMRDFLERLTERNFKNRKIALIENGSWAPNAAKVMQTILEKCTGLEFCQNTVKILSSLSEQNKTEILSLAKELTE